LKEVFLVSRFGLHLPLTPFPFIEHAIRNLVLKQEEEPPKLTRDARS